MEQAVEAALGIEREHERDASGEESNVQFVRALETAIAVCYWRPFTSSSSSIGSLDPVSDGPDESTGLGDLHRALKKMPDEVYAHTDKSSGGDAGVKEHVTDSGASGLVFSEGWWAFPGEWLTHVIPLAVAQRDSEPRRMRFGWSWRNRKTVPDLRAGQTQVAATRPVRQMRPRRAEGMATRESSGSIRATGMLKRDPARYSVRWPRIW
jgi:hypothetical protein